MGYKKLIVEKTLRPDIFSHHGLQLGIVKRIPAQPPQLIGMIIRLQEHRIVLRFGACREFLQHHLAPQLHHICHNPAIYRLK